MIPETLLGMANLGQNYTDAGRSDEAIVLLEDTLKRCREKLSQEHSTTLLATNNLAVAYQRKGCHEQALPLFEEMLRLRTKKLGPEDPDTLQDMRSVAVAYSQLGQFDRAIPLFEETLRLRKKINGEDHLDTLIARAELGGWLMFRPVDWTKPCHCSKQLITRVCSPRPSVGSVVLCWMDMCKRGGRPRPAALVKELSSAATAIAVARQPGARRMLAQFSLALSPISGEPNRLTLSGTKSTSFRGFWGGSVSRFLRCFAIKTRWVAYVGRLEIASSSTFSWLLTEIRLPALHGPRYDWASGVPIID